MAFLMLLFSPHRNSVMWAIAFQPFADEDIRGPRACSSHNERVKIQGLLPTLPKAYPHMLLHSRGRMNGRSPVWSRLPSEHQGLPSNHIITGPFRTCSGPHLCLCGAPRAHGKFPLCISITTLFLPQASQSLLFT